MCAVSDTLESFESYFAHCDQADLLRIEATPYTLYSSSPGRILELLSDAKILFIFRDPVERLISDYKMASWRGHRSAQESFAEFIDWQRRGTGVGLPSLIELGYYQKYLHPYFEIFGKDRVIVIFFEELKDDPVGTMAELCGHLGIDPEFYGQYQFDITNKARNPRSIAVDKVVTRLQPTVSKIRAKLMGNRVLHDAFEKALRIRQCNLRFHEF